MSSEKVSMIIGVVLLVVGIVVIFFVFLSALTIVNGVGDFFHDQFPELEEEEENEPPSAEFSWSSNDLNVWFEDHSQAGSLPITSWEWEFGDGETSNEQNPYHTYDNPNDYTVRLRVADQNGLRSSAQAEIHLEDNNGFNGWSEQGEEEGSMEVNFDVGNVLLPLAAAFLVATLFLVMFLVGAALIKAGWNLVKPGPSTIKMKIKPKRLEVEQAEPEPTYSSTPASYTSQVSPQQAYDPVPASAAVIASLKSLPESSQQNVPATQTPYAQIYHGNYQQPPPAPPQTIPEPNPENPIQKATNPQVSPNQTNLGDYLKKEQTSLQNPPGQSPGHSSTQPKNDDLQPSPKPTQTAQPSQKTTLTQVSSASNRVKDSRNVPQNQATRNPPTRTSQYQNRRPQPTQKKTQTSRGRTKGRGKKRGRKKRK